MGRKKETISRKAWQRAVNVLLWYPDTLKEYAALVDESMTRDPERKGGAGKPLAPDPTADAAIRLASNRKAANKRLEIEAVDMAMSTLTPYEMMVIRRRFWDLPKHGKRKPRQYDFMQDLPYSRRQMIRIVRRTIITVAAYLGE